MNNLLSNRILSFALTTFAFLLLFSFQIQAQTCMTITEDELSWTCVEEDEEFLYQNIDGVTIYDCSDPSIIYETPLPIVVIEELGCSSSQYPGVLRRITRTFVYDTGNPLDVLCPSYGSGFICETQVINVYDNTPPTFSFVPPNAEIECNEWNLEEYLKAGSFGLEYDDDCGTPELNQTFETVDETECSANISFIWTFTVTDVCGNLIQETHVVNVVDTTDPEIIFDPQIPDIYSCLAEVEWPSLTPFDMCSEVTVSWDGEPTITDQDCPNNFLLTRSATAIDDCGNDVTEEYTIVVNDTQIPQFIDLLSDITLECDNAAAIELAFSNLPTFNDGCNSNEYLNTDSVITDGACPQNYTVVKTFTVTDACGNISDPHEITITIEDTEAPIITLPTVGFQLECTEPLILDDPVVEDNCDSEVTSTEATNESGDISNGDFLSTTTYIATDDCGNTSEAATVVVNIVDTQPPYFTNFPEDLFLLCGDPPPNDAVDYEDSCDPNAYMIAPVWGIDFQDCANNTEISRTLTIFDDAGNNATQTQLIYFLDEDPPILLTPLDSLFYQCAYEVPDCMEIFDGLEFEDCSSGDVVPIDCSDVVVEGNCEEQACIIERTYFFEDACGNQGSAKQYITVQESVLAPEMPTGMTPNGDGYNDAYVIRGIGPSVDPELGEIQCDWLEDTRIRIINRWGSIVFETLDYRNDWEGITDSGEDLPPGTYFVVFEALGESFSTYVDIRR